MIYFDTSATNPLLPEVIDEMLRVMNLSKNRKLGNPSSLHTAGSRANQEMNEAREQVAKLIGVSPLSVIFTSGGTESNNTVINIFKNCPVITSAIEHPSVLRPAEKFANPCIKIPVDERGIINLKVLETKLRETVESAPKQKVLVSVMLANNEVGTIEPIKEIRSIIDELKREQKAKIYLHTDATQAIGKIPFTADTLGVDYLTFTSHKLGGPVGIAALYVKPGAPFEPFIIGGAQENHRRAGTSNAVLAAGFGVAAKLAARNLKEYQEVKKLRDYLKDRIKEAIPDAKIISPEDSICLPNVLNVAFPASEGESIQLYLDLEGIAVSTGSACASGDLEPSHVLMAMFHDAEVAHGSVRFSLGLNTTKAEIDELVEKLPPIITKIQDLSTLKKGQK